MIFTGKNDVEITTYRITAQNDMGFERFPRKAVKYHMEITGNFDIGFERLFFKSGTMKGP